MKIDSIRGRIYRSFRPPGLAAIPTGAYRFLQFSRGAGPSNAKRPGLQGGCSAKCAARWPAGAGCRSPPRQHRVRPHHPGIGQSCPGRAHLRSEAGTLIWLMPGQRHRLVRSPSLEMWVMNFRSELLEAAQLATLAAEPLKQLSGEALMDLDRLLSQVAQDSDDPLVYNAGITYVVRRALRASRDSPPANARPLHPAVPWALLLLRQSGAVDSLSRIAKAAGVTAPYLSRLLVEHTGRSFLDWRNRGPNRPVHACISSWREPAQHRFGRRLWQLHALSPCVQRADGLFAERLGAARACGSRRCGRRRKSAASGRLWRALGRRPQLAASLDESGDCRLAGGSRICWAGHSCSAC